MKNSRPDHGHRRPGKVTGTVTGTLAAALALLLALAQPAASRPELCERAAQRAAAESGVPTDVLMAIALVETGRPIDGRMRPWPWAANAEGRGYWFASAEKAAAFARQRLAQGRPSFDLGCFQINWRWHGQHFDRPEALLEPLTAARYAARFLSTLHDELGDWDAAAGAYHSRTPHLAQRYRARFVQHRAELAGTGSGASPGARRPQDRPAPPPPATSVADAAPTQSGQTQLALLQPGAPARDPASLVPAIRREDAPGGAGAAGAIMPRMSGAESIVADRVVIDQAPAQAQRAAAPAAIALTGIAPAGGIAPAAAQPARAGLLQAAMPAFIPALAGALP